MAIPRNAFVGLAEAILIQGAKKATKYLSKKEVIKATRRGKLDKRSRTTEILFTFGAPNYKERKFIQLCLQAGEPFPVHGIQVDYK